MSIGLGICALSLGADPSGSARLTQNKHNYNTFQFDLLEELEKLEDDGNIVEVLKRQLRDDSDKLEATLPSWVNSKYSEIYDKLLEARKR